MNTRQISCPLLCFLMQVASGRHKSEEDVRKVAKGRVWSGKDALALGLVDCLGGLEQAIEIAKQEAGLPLEVGSCFTLPCHLF